MVDAVIKRSNIRRNPASLQRTVITATQLGNVEEEELITPVKGSSGSE